MTPQWFGEYEIVKRLRVGGMATLYLARRHGAAGFARLVALKMIHSHLVEQPAFIEMFVDEARICSQISHPNVVHVEEFGVIDDVHYLVMEYLDGCSISELLLFHHRERRQLDPELAARIILQVASGLHAAHEARDSDGQPLDVVHRDISPSNILLSSDGNAKLIDFGIAKARNRVAETSAGVLLKGKYNYVAPEQATRNTVDRRCDIFSLGIVFWEMLVGKPLFPDDTHVALISRLAETDVVPPSAMNPAVPGAFDSIVLTMLKHDPADRPRTAAEVQRWIASAVPGAANRDASELGALAIEVRDKRAAKRTGSELPGFDKHAGFSSARRSSRGTSEHRSDTGVTSESAVHDAAPRRPISESSGPISESSGPISRPPSQPRPSSRPPSQPRPGSRPGLDTPPSRPGSQPGLVTPPPTRITAEPATPGPRWSRVQISLAGLVALGVVIGVVLGRRDGRPEEDASAARATRVHEADARTGTPVWADLTEPAPPLPSIKRPPESTTRTPESAVARTPESTVARTPEPLPSPAATSAVATAPATAKTTAPLTASPPSAGAAPMPPFISPPAEPTTTAGASAASGALARAPVRPLVQPIRRDRARVVIKPRPSRPGTSETEPARAAEPRTPLVPGARSPFSSVPFDDAGSSSVAPGAPNPGNAIKAPATSHLGN